MSKLKAIQVNSLPAGNYSDGNNLYLRVKPTGARSWVFRYKLNGKAVELGIGSTTVRSLSEARHLAIDMCRAIAAGSNPKQVLAPKQQKKSFADYARELIASKKDGWRNAKHAQQWVNTLDQYAFPTIGNKPIRHIDIEDLKKILNPIWQSKTETASRLRMRIEAVIDYGYLHEGIDKANPARWRGCLDHVYPSRKKMQPVKHFEAISYEQLPAIMTSLRAKSSSSALCVQWIMLTACRSSEARFMTWDEIDTDKQTWTIPAERMKAGQKHRVPLNQECLHILEIVRTFKSLGKNGIVFINQRGNALSDVAVSKTLKSVSFHEATIHGLRSGFRDWTADQTHFPHEVCEGALAHSLGAIEAAYRRSDLFNKRRELMSAWADYLNGSVANDSALNLGK